jgi:hypothetical protein
MGWSLRRAVAVAAGLALGAGAAVGASVAAAGATTASTNHWRMVYQTSVRGVVDGIAAISPSNAWAVWWTYTAKGAPVFQPGVLHWNGAKWSSVSVPGSKGYLMVSVAASSPNNVWLFGDTKTGAKVFRWDGAHWHTMGSNTMAEGALVLSASSAWAFEGGGCITISGKTECNSYLMQWNGKTWASVTLPFGLAGISGTAASGVYAAGTTARGYLFVLRWDGGTGWTLLSTPHPKVGTALGIAATGSKNIWVSVNPRGNSLYALHWNGSKWQQTSSLTVPDTNIGTSVVPDGQGGVWLGTWHWNGKSWVDTSASIIYSYRIAKVPGTSGSYWASAFTPDPEHHAAIAVYGPLP